jgi:hypothetical protein
MSEEAGLQFLGPDNVVIRKVRLIVISTSGVISMALIQDSGNFERTFNPGTAITHVIIFVPKCSFFKVGIMQLTGLHDLLTIDNQTIS